MGCTCSVSSQKNDPIDADMGSRNLGVPNATFPMAGSQQRLSVSSSGRSKVQLKPGHSLMDWIKLGRSGKDLTSVGGRRMQVTMEELEKHNQEGDAWLALRGNVYNVTPYLDFHPGGVDELMRGAGKDGTALFDEIHRWVNAESMLEKCYIGKLKVDSPQAKTNTVKNDQNGGFVWSYQEESDYFGFHKMIMYLYTRLDTRGGLSPQFLVPAAPPAQSPRFDWYQSKDTVSLVVYTKWPSLREDLVIVDLDNRNISLTIYLKDSVYFVNIELEKDVVQDFKVNVSGDSGKVEVVLQKSMSDVQWSTIGKHLDKHNISVKYADYNPAYRDCKVEKVETVTKDTKLLTVCLPDSCRMGIPIGYHVYIKHNIAGMEIIRSYTAVLPSLGVHCDDNQVSEGKKIYLMIKIYQNGAFTPWIDTLQPGDSMSISSFVGNFQLPRLHDCTHLVMFAAGTGFTPMVKLINYTTVTDIKPRSIKLLFFNKTVSDILWKEQLSALADKNDRFTFVNCLSEAGSEWTGPSGRVNKEMVEEFIPKIDKADKMLICVCGPTPFTQAVIKFCEELGHKEECHAFLG